MQLSNPNVQHVTPPTTTILPTTAGIFHSLKCFSHLIYVLQTRIWQNITKLLTHFSIYHIVNVSNTKFFHLSFDFSYLLCFEFDFKLTACLPLFYHEHMSAILSIQLLVKLFCKQLTFIRSLQDIILLLNTVLNFLFP